MDAKKKIKTQLSFISVVFLIGLVTINILLFEILPTNNTAAVNFMKVFIPASLVLFIMTPIFGFVTSFYDKSKGWKITLAIMHFILGAALIPFSIAIIAFRYFVSFGG